MDQEVTLLLQQGQPNVSERWAGHLWDSIHLPQSGGHQQVLGLRLPSSPWLRSRSPVMEATPKDSNAPWAPASGSQAAAPLHTSAPPGPPAWLLLGIQVLRAAGSLP